MTDTYNTRGLGFCLSKADLMKDLVLPFKAYGISDLHYFRMLRSGHYLSFVSNKDFLKTYIEEQAELSPYFSETFLNQQQTCLWYKNDFDDSFRRAYSFDIAHGISFREISNGYFEAFSFTAKRENQQILNTYVNWLSSLRSYLSLVSDKVNKLEGVSDKKNYVCYKNQPPQEIFMSPRPFIPIRGSFLDADAADSFLRPREIETLKKLSEGKSFKEIAQEMNISWRTVETHIKNIKSRTKLTKKSDLVNLFRSNYN